MCGLAGTLKLTSDAVSPGMDILSRMIKLVHHRGPDETGYYIDEDIGLAHARLSIIDLSDGKQPIHNKNKDIWIVFNGEIYNYLELRVILAAKGYSFYTKTDTEVIVALYEEYGENFVDHLNGQFAIALWDSKAKKLILTRDRTGIAPLFYCIENNNLYFSSEIKSILAARMRSARLNLVALDQLFTFWSPISPNTVFENIFEISPGEILSISNGKIAKRKYWDWSFPDDNQYNDAPVEKLADDLRELLVDATRIRLRADVPVGGYLSGGLDSSVLVSIIKNFTDTPLRTFSIEFEESGLDESKYQKQLVDYLETEHSRILCKNSQISDNFEKVIWHTELPILRSAPVPMSMLSRLVRESNYKVVLTGEGSDEVLGGYDIFKETKIRQFWAKNVNSGFRSALLKKLYPYLDVSPGKAQNYLKEFFGQGIDNPNLDYFSHMPRWDTTSRIKDFYSSDMKDRLKEDVVSLYQSTLPANFQKWHSFNKSQYIESKTLMSGYLLCSQGDRMLMMNSIEGRFPFLDHRVIEFANRLHPKFKMKGLNEKYLLKKAMGDYVPVDIMKRHKQPYRAPDISSFTGDNAKNYVYELMGDELISRYNYFDPKKVEFLLRKIKAGKAIGYKDNMAFMAILSTQCLHKLFIERTNF